MKSYGADMSVRDSNESKLASEFVGEFLGRDMSKLLADLKRTKVSNKLN